MFDTDPIIIDFDFQYRELQAGVSAYVVEPVNFHEFVNAVKELEGSCALINEPPPGSVKKR